MKNEARMELTVPVPLHEAYRAWEDVEKWPRWMEHLEHVQRTSRRTARYRMRLPGGRQAAWDVELTMLRQNETIAWSSLEGDLVTYGRADFMALGPTTTRIRVRRFHGTGRLQDPSVLSASGFGDPWQRLEQDLRGFAAYLQNQGAPPVDAAPRHAGAFATAPRRASAGAAAPQVPRRPTKLPAPPGSKGAAAPAGPRTSPARATALRRRSPSRR